MGFNKRVINYKLSLKSLQNHNLKVLYGVSDMFIFEDELSSKIYDLYKEGMSDNEILLTIKNNMEEMSDEMYQSN